METALTTETWPIVVFRSDGEVHSLFWTTQGERPCDVHESALAFTRAVDPAMRVVTLPPICRRIAWQLKRNGRDSEVYAALRAHYA